MRFTYKQYGSVALIYEDGKAVCTAQFKDGLWEADTYPMLGHPARVFYQVPPVQSGRTLDELIEGIEDYPRGV